jgi:hypothetical protein
VVNLFPKRGRDAECGTHDVRRVRCGSGRVIESYRRSAARGTCVCEGVGVPGLQSSKAADQWSQMKCKRCLAEGRVLNKAEWSGRLSGPLPQLPLAVGSSGGVQMRSAIASLPAADCQLGLSERRILAARNATQLALARRTMARFLTARIT